jgi:hypothetical protein
MDIQSRRISADKIAGCSGANEALGVMINFLLSRLAFGPLKTGWIYSTTPAAQYPAPTIRARIFKTQESYFE